MATESSDLKNKLKSKAPLPTILEDMPTSANNSKCKKPSPLQNPFLPQRDLHKRNSDNSATPLPGILKKSPGRH